MPVYNESTARTFAALQAICEVGRSNGPRRAFRLFRPVGFDQPGCLDRRGARVSGPVRTDRPEARIFYRHRPKNHHRKAGNIADFVTRWGGAYEHMLVLDADSLMTGDTHRRASPPPWRPTPTPASSRPCRSSSTATRCSRACSSSRRGCTGRSSPPASRPGWAATATTGAITPSSARGRSRRIAACRT